MNFSAVTLFVITATMWAGACSLQQNADAPKPSTAAVEVHVSRVSPVSGESYEDVVGSVRAKLHATLEARVTGRIQRMPIKLGERIRTGAVIAQLDVAELRARLAQAQAAHRQAEIDVRRITSLVESQSATRQELDAAETRLRVTAGSADEIAAMVSYSQVTAPFAGVVTGKFADVGDVASPGRPLAEIEDPSRLRLEVNIPEALLPRVKVGQSLPIEIESLTDLRTATIAEIAPTADPNSRTFLVKLDLPRHENLRAGLFGRALIPTAATQLLRVPRTAVLQRGQMEVAFIVRGTTSELRLVKTGKRLGTDIEVLSGISQNETVVVDPPLGLEDGAQIRVLP